MNSIDEFHFRYYANRLLREGYITPQEYTQLLALNSLEHTLVPIFPNHVDGAHATRYNG